VCGNIRSIDPLTSDSAELSFRKHINALGPLKIMRGRWAAAAVGAGVARRRAGAAEAQQNQAHDAEMQKAQQQIDAQQKQLEAMQQQKQQPQPQQQQQEDPTQKLKKYADLKQQGVITEEEFEKLKADLLSKM
jgi:membrane protease subunit (stomatin/prohibitin family)